MDAKSDSKIKEQVWHNRNLWNDPSLAQLDRENPNDYKVYPEIPIDSDHKINPYSNV